MATELLVIRIGETTWNVDGRLQGQSGSELTDLGKQQAAAVGEHLSSQRVPVGVIYTSDLIGAAETAQIIADKLGGCEVRSTPLLRERHLGILEGLPWVEARRLQSKAYKAMVKDQPIPGGGESERDVCERANQAVEEIHGQHQWQRIVLVTHGSVVQALHINAKGSMGRGNVLTGSITVFTVSEDNELEVRSWCDVSHLRDLSCL